MFPPNLAPSNLMDASPIGGDTPTVNTNTVNTVNPDEEREQFVERVKDKLKQLLEDARTEDKAIRQDMVRLWTQLDYYWENVLDIFLDPVSKTWRVPNWDELLDEDESYIPPRLINIYRPHGEAIVAALTVTIPATMFFPDDADNVEDVEAAKAYRSIAELLARHNDGEILFIKVITILFNNGTVFGYNFYKSDPKFGVYSKEKIEVKDVLSWTAFCPLCGTPLDGNIGQAPPGHAAECPECGYKGATDTKHTVEKLPQIVGFDQTAKGTVAQEIHSGKNVKVSAYAKSQQECGYLLLEFNQSTAMLRSIFRDRADKIGKNSSDRNSDTFNRQPVYYNDSIPENTSQVSCLWLRPWQYFQLGGGEEDLEFAEQLSEQFPSGCYCIFVDDELMDAYEENMDDHWTISKNPMGQGIYARPLGENLATVQDLRNNTMEIRIQTAEFGIPETFVDPKVLNLKEFGSKRARPGMLTAAKAPSGKSLSDSFFTTQMAHLSPEVESLNRQLDQDAQFVVGSFPSVYGGPSLGGSKTASEYSQSRSFALQRLQTIWKLACDFWSNFQARSSVEFAGVLRELQVDEKFTIKQGNSYINKWIRHTSLTGRIGHIEPEASEQLPSSWAQKKDTIAQLFQVNNPEVVSVLTHPRNAGVIKTATGLEEIYIPGEEDRERQLKEFALLSQGVSVPTNPFDNHAVHAEILQGLLEASDDMPPEIIQVCMAHWQEHQMALSGSGALDQEKPGQVPASKPEGPPVNNNQYGQVSPVGAE